MRCPDRTLDEYGRLRALEEYRIDPQQGLPSLDPIVDLAARLFDCPTAAVNLVGEDHVFLASSVGSGEYDFRRDLSFCAHAINQNGVMVVEDAALDPRFHDNPMVMSNTIRFYAGVPLRSPAGHALGALCVIDGSPRTEFAEADQQRLRQIGEMVADRLELRRLEVAAAASELGRSAAASPNAILSCDSGGRIVAVNAAACAMFGCDEAGLIGTAIEALVVDEDRRKVRGGMRVMRRGGVPLLDGGPLGLMRRNGQRFVAEVHWSYWREGEDTRFGAIARDLTPGPGAPRGFDSLASFESLTGLPHRGELLRELGAEMARRGDPALILAGLAGFGDIRNTLGTGVGDKVLRLSGHRIRTILPEARLVAQLGGDEFGIMLGSRDPITLAQKARQMIAGLAAPILVDGHELRIGCHCGIATGGQWTHEADELLGNAELALLQAREQGRGTVSMFVPQLRAAAVARRQFDAEVHHAFALGQFRVHYQPQVRLDDAPRGRLSAEALIRWQHPERGLLMPAAFLPSIEESQLAEPLGAWVLEQACAQLALWRRSRPDFTMSVNISAAQLRQGALVDQVAAVLAAHDLPGEALDLEITENIVLDQRDLVLDQMRRIRKLGVRLSFDDFGTGFASLNLLRDFPVTQIKIDKSFIQRMWTSQKDRMIVVGLIGLARELKLEVVAEGVENEEALGFLREHGCHKGQGYLFGRPCDAGPFGVQFLGPTEQWANG